MINLANINFKISWLNLFLYSFVLLFFCTIQTTVWYQFFGDFGAPNFWLLMLTYISLNRPRMKSYLENYGLGLILYAFTVKPLGILLLLIALLNSTILIVKNRVFWDDSRYFTMCVIGVSILKNIYELILNWVLVESAPFVFTFRFSEIFLTILIAPVFFSLLRKMDEISLKSLLKETEAAELHG